MDNYINYGYPFICQYIVHLYIRRSVCLLSSFGCPPVCRSVCLSVPILINYSFAHQFLHLSAYLYVLQFVRLSVCMHVCPSSVHFSVRLPICSFDCPSTYPFVYIVSLSVARHTVYTRILAESKTQNKKDEIIKINIFILI